MKCGAEADFVLKYANVIVNSQVSLVAVYDSPQCAAMVNYYNSSTSVTRNAFSFLYKLVPIDTSSQNNTTSYERALSRLVNRNLTSEHNVTIFLTSLHNLLEIRVFLLLLLKLQK